MSYTFKPKTLFLLTKTYPFGTGEQYVTSELSFLSNFFEKIILYPNDYYNTDEKHDKNLPANVSILNLNTLLPLKSKNSLSDYFYLAKNTINEFLRTDDRTGFLKNFKWDLINFWTQLQISKIMSAYLKEKKYNSDNSVFYSYWFHKSAILLSILKDKKHINSFVSRAHSIDLYHNYWGIINQDVVVPSFKMFKLRFVDEVISVSEHGRVFLKKKFPQYSNKFTLGYLGVQEVEGIKKEHNPFVIVTCSGFDINKRVHLLAKALTEMKDHIEWFHFGDGGSMKEEAMQYVKKFGPNIKANFMGQTLNTQVRQFMTSNKIHLFVNLSIVEGLPVSIMEAMASKIAILATAVYGTPEAVSEQKNGFLLNVDFTIEELRNKLEYCSSNKALLEKMGQESYKLFLQNFSADKNYTNFANHLQSL